MARFLLWPGEEVGGGEVPAQGKGPGNNGSSQKASGPVWGVNGIPGSQG